MQKELLCVMIVACGLSACLGGGGSGKTGGGNRKAANHPPTISGTPPSTTGIGEAYEFIPIAVDPDGDALAFNILHRPSWATFDQASGRLAGTPDAADVGQYANITISVSDGQAAAALSVFDIDVDQLGEGSVTLSWMPPTVNVDGSALLNLAGYRIYYGRSGDSLNQSIVLNNPGLTSYMVENLSDGQWHFAMASINAKGTESQRSSTVSKMVG